MNKKVLVYLCGLILFISVSLNIFFISYSNNVKRSTNLIINNMVNLVENKYSGVVAIDIIKELNSSELKETSLSKYGIDISDFISLKMKNDNLKYLIILNIIVTCLSLFIIIYNLILKLYKNKKIEELTDLIKEINNKNYVLDMKDNVEDDTSILKSELYKTTIMLKESAENSLKDKLSIKEFIEDTSHQLKTPLASISIILDNLIDNPNMDNKLRESFLKDINREISKINNLVNTMLKLSMFEVNAIKFDRKYNSLKSIIEKSIENVSMIMDLKNVKVNLDIKEDVLIKCDYTFEVEAISNILKNEVEYSKEFGKIDITVNDNKLYTTVIIKDYGIGISENDLKNIFNRFYRGENSNTNSAGIGLSLAKKIILMDNGKISVESKKNEYTIFKIKYYKA